MKDIPQYSHEILFCFDSLAPETILEQIPRPLIFSVKPHGISGFDPGKGNVQRFAGRFNQQMDMIGHQRKRIEPES